MDLSVDYNKPIGNGVLTCLNFQQARKRAFDWGKQTRMWARPYWEHCSMLLFMQ